MAAPLWQLLPGDTVRIRAERWVVNQRSSIGDVVAIDVRGADQTNVGTRARFLLPFEPVERIAVTHTPKVVRRAEWRAVTRAILAGSTPSPDSLRVARRARFDVLPYQLEPALAVIGGHACRLLIADEVGLGKTVQAGLIVAELLERDPNGRALVVCPAALRAQWRQELHQQFDLDAVVLDSLGLARLTSTYETSANPWAATPLAITSIDYIKRPEVMRALEGLIWDALVIDEAHNVTGRSDRGTAAAAIGCRARVVVLLSATPHSGDDAEFARLCSIGDVRGRFPLLLFRRTRPDVGIGTPRHTRWLHVRPTAAESRMHTALIDYSQRIWRDSTAGDGGRLAVTVLLRRAASSAEALARSLERRLAALQDAATTESQLALPLLASEADEEPVGSLLAPGLANRPEERRLVQQLLAVARFAAARESKIATVLRWIARVREPVLVFTEYRDTLRHLRAVLVGGGVPDNRIAELHGGMTRSEREYAERRFVTGDADILLATDAASEGLNLHHRCRCVISLEIPWNPIRVEQRVGRVDRIGQTRPVHAIHLVGRDTYELNTVRRLIDRAARAAGALRDDTPSHDVTTAAILTGIDLPDVGPPTPLPATVQRIELSARANAEAIRIATARVLSRESTVEERRPVATAISKHCRRVVSAFLVTISDGDGVPVWATLVGVEGDVRAERLNPQAVRDALAAATGCTMPILEPAIHRFTPMTAEQIGRAIDLGVAREQAIVAAVRLRHARVAADLLQPGLFDRRAERQAAAQTAVLEEALGRCHARLEALGRLKTLRVEPPTLRFAALLA
jgi:superfamily II DNA or RNA helicase